LGGDVEEGIYVGEGQKIGGMGSMVKKKIPRKSRKKKRPS